MPTTLKLMNWNIEQFGKKRAGQEGAYQRVTEIININAPDLLSIIELKTKVPSKAMEIADGLLAKMPGNYRYILSYQNLLEMYCFIYNSDKLIPLCLPCGVTEVLKNGFEGYIFHLADGANTTVSANDSSILCNYFPLVEHSAKNTRPPAAGFFKLKNSANDFFALLAWHNAAGHYIHEQQMAIERLPVSEMQDMSQTDYIRNGFRVPTANGTLNIPNVILSGDFNVDYLGHNQNIYQRFTGYTTVLTQPGQKTHLHVYSPANNTLYNTSQSLRSAILDNFIVKNSIHCSNPLVYDIPASLKTSNTTLRRGFRQSWAASQKGMKSRTKVRVNGIVKTRFKANYMPEDTKRRLLKFLKSDMALNNGGMSAASQKRLQGILRDEPQTVAEVLQITTDEINANYAYYQRAREVIARPATAFWNDALMLTRWLYSDHLPTLVDITI